MYEYEKFSEETKKFFQKVMDIYANIEPLEIQKVVEKIGCDKQQYTLSRLDKKVFSMFIASFTTDIHLQSLLGEYDDIKKEDLFSFIGIKEEEIKPLESFYLTYYNTKFKLDLFNMVEEDLDTYSISEITPEFIYYLLRKNVAGSDVVAYFMDSMKEHLNYSGFTHLNHPSFKTVNNYLVLNHMIQYKNSTTKKNSLFLTEEDDLTLEQKRQNLFTKSQQELWTLLEEIKKKFIGQERLVEDLFYTIIYNQDLASNKRLTDGERAILFIDGPTGTGKTAITREICRKLTIPVAFASSVNYSSTGYEGANITDLLAQLYQASGNNLQLAERGIILLDEFDKLAYTSDDGIKMKKAVQQQLLDFLGGGVYPVNIGNKFLKTEQVEFDTSKLTFILLGALSELRDKKIVDSDIYSIMPEDLIAHGLERELVGRINTYLHTDEYTKEDLLRILKESSISPILSLKKGVFLYGKELIIDEEIYEDIVNAAYDLHSGARGLQTIINNIRTSFLKEILRGEEQTIYLGKERVKEDIEKIFVRRINR